MTTGRSAMQEVAPKLAEITADTLFGDVWERPLLSKRDRSLITVAVLQALYNTNELRVYIDQALDDNGVMPEELSEVILHVAFYAGWPPAVNTSRLLSEAFKQRGISLDVME